MLDDDIEVEKIEVEDETDYSGYVRVPFSFAYVIGCMDALDNLSDVKGYTTDGLHHPQTTYSQTEINEILLNDKEVIQDIHRTSWEFGRKDIPEKMKVSEKVPRNSFLNVQDMQASLEATDLKLTLEEASALYAFACTSRTERASESGKLPLKSLQGGLFGMPFYFITAIWLLNIGICPKDTADPERQVTRGDKNALNVLFNIKINDFNFFNRIYNQFGNKNNPDKPLLFSSNPYKINEKEGGFTCTRMNTPESSTLFIEREFFNNHLIPAAKEKLAGVNLAAPLSQGLAQNLIFFIPLLSDPGFAQEFFNKLQGRTIPPGTSQFLLDHTKLCFGERPITVRPPAPWEPPTFWERNEGKIGFAIVGLMVAAAIIATSIMTLGLPVIIAAMGAIVFGVGAAVSGAALVGIGGVIGSIFDDKRALEFEAMERNHENIMFISNHIAQAEALINEYRKDNNEHIDILGPAEISSTATTDSSISGTFSFSKNERPIYSQPPISQPPISPTPLVIDSSKQENLSDTPTTPGIRLTKTDQTNTD